MLKDNKTVNDDEENLMERRITNYQYQRAMHMKNKCHKKQG